MSRAIDIPVWTGPPISHLKKKKKKVIVRRKQSFNLKMDFLFVLLPTTILLSCDDAFNNPVITGSRVVLSHDSASICLMIMR